MNSSPSSALQDMSPQKVIRAFLTYLMGDSGVFLLNAGVFAWLLHHLTADNYGYFVEAGSIALILVPLVDLGITVSGVYLATVDQKLDWRMIRLMIRLRILVACFLLVSALVAWRVITDRILARLLLAYAPVFFLNALQLDFACIAIRRPGIYASSRLAGAVVFLVGAMLLVRSTTPLWAIPLIQSFSSLFILAIQYIGLSRASSGPATKGEGLRLSSFELLRKTAPVMGAQLTTFAVFNIGVIILGFVYHVDRVTTGDFGAAMRLVYIAIMPIGALGLVTASHYAHGYQSPSPAEFRRAARIFLAGCLILGICGSAVLIPYGYKILELMSGRPMEASRSTLHIIGIGYLFVALYSPFSTVLPYMNAGRSYLLANSIALGIGLALNLLLIPHWGHIGASIAWLASVGSLVLIGYGFYRVQLRQARWASG